jgi:voltage-gated potassium channel
MRLTSELVRPNVVEFLDQMLRDDETLRVEEVRIPEGSKLVGCPLGESDIRTSTSALVLAVRETGNGQFHYNPGPSFVLRAGMTLMVLSHREDLQRLQRGIERGTIGRA